MDRAMVPWCGFLALRGFYLAEVFVDLKAHHNMLYTCYTCFMHVAVREV